MGRASWSWNLKKYTFAAWPLWRQTSRQSGNNVKLHTQSVVTVIRLTSSYNRVMSDSFQLPPVLLSKPLRLPHTWTAADTTGYKWSKKKIRSCFASADVYYGGVQTMMKARVIFYWCELQKQRGGVRKWKNRRDRKHMEEHKGWWISETKTVIEKKKKAKEEKGGDRKTRNITSKMKSKPCQWTQSWDKSGRRRMGDELTAAFWLLS